MEKCSALSIPPTQIYIGVSIHLQELYLLEDGTVRRIFSISTSKKEPSCIEDSLGTPWGLHKISAKVGDGAPMGMVFRGREPTGKCFHEYDDKTNQQNLITTRILRLSGLERGLNSGGNCDSWRRYIYIHGTNHEEKIGSPASSGCVQLSNVDVMTLFEMVTVGTLVLIEKEPSSVI